MTQFVHNPTPVEAWKVSDLLEIEAWHDVPETIRMLIDDGVLVFNKDSVGVKLRDGSKMLAGPDMWIIYEHGWPAVLTEEAFQTEFSDGKDKSPGDAQSEEVGLVDETLSTAGSSPDPFRHASVGDQEIENRFGFHTTTIEGDSVHAELRRNFKQFAKFLDKLLPAGRAKSLAFTELEDASMWAHKAVELTAPLVSED
jgi:hypothetical protein